MPEAAKIVVNTGPILALVAALGDLKVLRALYQEVWVPFEVCQEIEAGGSPGFAVEAFLAERWFTKTSTSLEIPSLLLNSLDRGEASVIQLALEKEIPTVCIDEAAGRRVARLSGLNLTGSIEILLRAHHEGYPFSIEDAIQGMQDKGVWLSQSIIDFVLTQIQENH